MNLPWEYCILLTMSDSRTRLSQQVEDNVRQHLGSTVPTVIPRNVLAEAPSYGQPIFAAPDLLAPQLTARRGGYRPCQPGLGDSPWSDALLPKVEQGAQRLPVSELRLGIAARQNVRSGGSGRAGGVDQGEGVLQPILPVGHDGTNCRR